MGYKTLKLTTLKKWRNVQVKINLGVSPYDNVTVCLNGPDLALQLVELAEITTNVDVFIPAEIIPQLEWVARKTLEVFKSVSFYDFRRHSVLLCLSKIPNIEKASLSLMAQSVIFPDVLQVLYDLYPSNETVLQGLSYNAKTPVCIVTRIPLEVGYVGLLHNPSTPLCMLRDLWKLKGPSYSLLARRDFVDSSKYLEAYLDGELSMPISTAEGFASNIAHPDYLIRRLLLETDLSLRKRMIYTLMHSTTPKGQLSARKAVDVILFELTDNDPLCWYTICLCGRSKKARSLVSVKAIKAFCNHTNYQVKRLAQSIYDSKNR